MEAREMSSHKASSTRRTVSHLRNAWTGGTLQKFLDWQFLGIWQALWVIILESLYVNTTQIRNKWDGWKSSSQGKRGGHLRCYCSPVWKTNGGRILWNGIAICEIIRINFLIGKHVTKGGSECLQNGPVIPFGAMVQYHTISAKSQSRLHQFGSKVLPGIFLGFALHAGWIWKGDIMVAYIEELEEMDASELHARRLNAKEVSTPQRSGNFIFLVADGAVKIFGGGQRLRTSTLTLGRPERGEEQGILQWNSDEWYTPSHQDDSTRDDAEAKNDFWSITGDFIYRHHFGNQSQTVRAERRIISNSTEVHRHCQNHSYILGFLVGETYWRLLERGWRKRIIRCVDRLHKNHLIERKATWRIHMVWEETHERTHNLSSRWCVARYVESYVWCSEKESKTKKGYRDTEARQCQTMQRKKLHRTRQWRFKLIMKAARRKLEFPIPAAMPCKMPIKSSGETPAVLGNARQNMLVLSMPTKVRDQG